MVKLHVERVRTALMDLCEPLHGAFSWAEALRRERLPEVSDRSTYGWFASHTVRALAHYKLRHARIGTLGSWRLCGQHSQNGALWLTDGNYRLRLLHAHVDDHVPNPGSNAARRGYYRNPPLYPEQLALIGDPDDRLLGVWQIDQTSAVPAFRVVRPIGVWKWGERAKVDLEFPLPQTAKELSHLEFQPTDEALDLMMPNRTDEEGDDDARGSYG